MTDVLEGQAPEVESEDSEKKDRDFTKFRPLHEELAAFVNANSGLDAVTPNQVKAVIALRGDFNNTPEQQAKRAERKQAREAEKAKYEGLSPEQIKAEKAATRAEKQAEKLQARVQEAMDKARRIREGKEGDGDDLAAAVEQQNGEESGEPRRRGIRRK